MLNLKQNLANKKRKRQNDDDSSTGGNNGRDRRKVKAGNQGDIKTERLPNPRPNPKWTIPKSVRFKDCMYKDNKMLDIPLHDGVPFCLQLFCLNSCKRGSHCNLVHKDPRDVGTEAAFDAFCKKAYST